MTCIWHEIFSINVCSLTERLSRKIHGIKKSSKGQGHTFSFACEVADEMENRAQPYLLWCFCDETYGALLGHFKKHGLWTYCWGKNPIQQAEISCGVSGKYSGWMLTSLNWQGSKENKKRRKRKVKQDQRDQEKGKVQFDQIFLRN